MWSADESSAFKADESSALHKNAAVAR
jgi:hypothetical protein